MARNKIYDRNPNQFNEIFMDKMLSIILKDRDIGKTHPLDFLVEEGKDNPKKCEWKERYHRKENPSDFAVQAGHVIASVYGFIGIRLAIESALLNNMMATAEKRISVENTGRSVKIINGIFVEFNSADFWVRKKFLDASIFKNAPFGFGWSPPNNPIVTGYLH